MALGLVLAVGLYLGWLLRVPIDEEESGAITDSEEPREADQVNYVEPNG